VGRRKKLRGPRVADACGHFTPSKEKKKTVLYLSYTKRVTRDNKIIILITSTTQKPCNSSLIISIRVVKNVKIERTNVYLRLLLYAE